MLFFFNLIETERHADDVEMHGKEKSELLEEIERLKARPPVGEVVAVAAVSSVDHDEKQTEPSEMITKEVIVGTGIILYIVLRFCEKVGHTVEQTLLASNATRLTIT